MAEIGIAQSQRRGLPEVKEIETFRGSQNPDQSRSHSASLLPMSNSRSLSRSALALAGSHDGGALRVRELYDSMWPSRNSTLATFVCRKCTEGYCPDGGSSSGTSISTGVPLGHGSIHV